MKEPEIHPTAIIGKNVKFGNDVKIGIFVIIGDHVQIGDNVKVNPYCEIRQNCRIGNNVSFGSRCTLAENTIVEDDTVIKYGFVATDTPKIGDNKKLPCHIRNGAKFGANVTLMPGVKVGRNSQIGACSQVRHDIPDNEIWYGNPARFFKKVQENRDF